MANEHLAKLKNEGNFLSRIERLERKLDMLERRGISAGSLAEIAPDLGTIRTGELYALVSGVDPTDSDACGVFISSSGQTFLGIPWNLGGVNNGVLMFGLSSEDGRAYFAGGAAILDVDGFEITGLRYAVHHIAWDLTNTYRRDGWLQQWIPTGRSLPSYGMQFSEGAGLTIENGDAEHGDLSHWTDAGAKFSAQAVELYSGSYSFAAANVGSGETDTLTSDRIACVGDTPYKFSLYTKDQLGMTFELDASADVVMMSGYPTTNTSSWTTVGAGFSQYSTPDQETLRSLVKFGTLAGLTTKVISQAYITAFPINNSGGSRIIDFFRALVEWVEAEATWNIRSTGNNWTAAGADNAADRDTTSLGTLTSASTDNYTAKTASLDVTEITKIIDGTYDDFGFVIKSQNEASGSENSVFWRSKDSSVEYQRHTLTIVEKPSTYAITVNWYDDPAAGSLLRTDTICEENGIEVWNLREKSLTAPTGALSCSIVVTAEEGMGFYFDDFSATNILGALYFDPQLVLQDTDGSINRVMAAKREMFAPLAPVLALVTTAVGNCTNGAHLIKVTNVDEFGETEASAASNSVTVDAAHKQITATIVAGPWGTTSRKIYMTEAGGATYKLLTTVADNSTLSVTINTADAGLGTATAPTANTSGSRPLIPRTASIPACSAVSNATLTYAAQSYTPECNTTAANAANGDWFEWDFWLQAGTYTVRFLGTTQTFNGKLDWYLDNVSIVTGQEWYANPSAYKQYSVASVTVSGNGYHKLRAVVNGKHASSTDYGMDMSWIFFIPAAH
jgi:hypothetical protein